jgi:hypothetical protein
MGWVKAGEPVVLPVALCLDGVQVTMQQMKMILQEFQVDIPKNLKRADLQAFMIHHFLAGNQDAIDEALSKTKQVPKEAELGQDMDEVLDALEEDEGNFQEIKKFKEQLKKRKATVPWAFANLLFWSLKHWCPKVLSCLQQFAHSQSEAGHWHHCVHWVHWMHWVHWVHWEMHWVEWIHWVEWVHWVHWVHWQPPWEALPFLRFLLA